MYLDFTLEFLFSITLYFYFNTFQRDILLPFTPRHLFAKLSLFIDYEVLHLQKCTVIY